MNPFRQIFASSLARRMGLAVFIASVAIIAISSILYLFVNINTELAQIETKVVEAGESRLSSISERVWVADIESLKLDLAGMLQIGPVKYLSVTDNGRILAEAGTLPTENIISRTFPVEHEFQGKPVQIAELSIVASSTDLLSQFFARSVLAVAVFTVQIFLIVGLILVLFNRNVTRHLRAIADFARNIELSNIDQTMTLDRATPKKEDELDILLHSLTSMQHQLNQSVRSLRENEENLSLTLDCIGDAVIATDFGGSVARMNPIAEQLTGWSSSEAIGKNIKEVFPIVDAVTGEVVENPVDQAIGSGKIVTLSNSTTLIAKNGERYQIADSAAPIRNSTDDIIGGILVFHDVTEQYFMRQSLQETRKRMKLHVDQTPLGVIEWDMDFKVTEWNPAAEKIFGYSWEEAIGKQYKDLVISPAEIEGVEDRWDAFIGSSVAEHFLVENITKEGKHLYCEWYSTPLLDEHEETIGVASLVLDVSERIATEHALAQHQAEQAMLLDYMLDAIISTDADGLIESFNTSAENMFGYKGEEVIGKELRIILPKEGWPLYEKLRTQPVTMRGRGTLAKVYEVDAINKEGRVFPIRFSIGVPPIQGNSKQKFIYSIHDLTIENQKEEQLRHSQKMDALGKLTGGIAHDYNNMLGIILGYTELLDMILPQDSRFREYLEKIEQASERGVALTKKMLSLSRRQAVEASSVNINEVLLDQQQVLQKTLTARITVEMKLAPDLWPVWIDEGDFSDVIVNLSINAMHATESTGTLIFESYNKTFSRSDEKPANVRTGDYVVLQVSDTGAGMDKDTVERVFDPFFTTKGDKGSGLGLSQVYGFMGRSDGAIKVESELKKGSCFTLYFPRDLSVERVDDAAREQMQNGIIGGDEAILIIDDELDLLNMASEMVSRHGYTVYTAAGADKALEVLSKNHIDLVVSDVVMPEMGGYELAEQIYRKHPGVPVQLVSGFNEPEKVGHLHPELQKNLISKPYTSNILLGRVRELLDN